MALEPRRLRPGDAEEGGAEGGDGHVGHERVPRAAGWAAYFPAGQKTCIGDSLSGFQFGQPKPDESPIPLTEIPNPEGPTG
jgi:hypothetical protein